MKYIHEQGYDYILKELNAALEILNNDGEINKSSLSNHIKNAKFTLLANNETKPRKKKTKFVNEERW